MTYEVVLEALSDGTRRDILARLRTGPRPVGVLAEGLPVSRPAVSQHLKVLKAAGLVREQKIGTRHVYRLERDGFASLRNYLDQYWGDVLSDFATALDRDTHLKSKTTGREDNET